jgi:putative peptidoglycan lipid II flippase
MARSHHLVRSSLLVILIFALNKITGFGKLILMTSIFGTSPAADAYAAANQLPELFLSMLTGGALAAALIPIYSAYQARQDETQARELANTVLTLTLLVVGGICAAAAIGAPWLVRVVLVPDFTLEQQAFTANLMRIVLLSSVIISIGSLFTSLLHAHQHFIAPAWGTVAIDTGQIIGIVLLSSIWGIYGVAWGSVLGATLLVVVQIPALLRHCIHLRLQLALRIQGIRELGRLMGPRVVTLGVFQAVDLVFIRLASQLPDGTISAYFYAMLAMVAMPKSLFGTAISNVIFPTLAEQYNSGDSHYLRQTVTHGLRATWLLLLPAALGLLTLGQPAVAFLFQRGAFDDDSTMLVYTLMAILSIRLIGDASQDILSLFFYARHNTLTPMWLNLGWMVLNIGLSVILVGPFGIFGLAWATSLASLILALALFGLSYAMGGLDEPLLWSTLRRLLPASAAMCTLILILRSLQLPTLSYLALAIGNGVLAFLATYILLGGQEILTVMQTLRRR